MRCITNFSTERARATVRPQIFDSPCFRNHRPFRLFAIPSILEPRRQLASRQPLSRGFFNFSFVFCSASHEMNTRRMAWSLGPGRENQRAGIDQSLPALLYLPSTLPHPPAPTALATPSCFVSLPVSLSPRTERTIFFVRSPL